MNPFSILFLIFGACVLLVGFYMFRGHKLDKLLWRAQYQNLTVEEWKNIGKWTMIASIPIFLLAIAGIIFNFR